MTPTCPLPHWHQCCHMHQWHAVLEWPLLCQDPHMPYPPPFPYPPQQTAACVGWQYAADMACSRHGISLVVAWGGRGMGRSGMWGGPTVSLSMFFSCHPSTSYVTCASRALPPAAGVVSKGYPPPCLGGCSTCPLDPPFLGGVVTQGRSVPWRRSDPRRSLHSQFYFGTHQSHKQTRTAHPCVGTSYH